MEQDEILEVYRDFQLFHDSLFQNHKTRNITWVKFEKMTSSPENQAKETRCDEIWPNQTRHDYKGKNAPPKYDHWFLASSSIAQITLHLNQRGFWPHLAWRKISSFTCEKKLPSISLFHPKFLIFYQVIQVVTFWALWLKTWPKPEGDGESSK